MRIAVIGGRYENEGQLARIARAAGCELHFEEAHRWGRGMNGIRAAVARSNLVVLVTDVSSQGAVQLAKQVAQEQQRPTLTLQHFGAARLCRLLDALERPRHAKQPSAESHSDDLLPLASGIAR